MRLVMFLPPSQAVQQCGCKQSRAAGSPVQQSHALRRARPRPQPPIRCRAPPRRRTCQEGCHRIGLADGTALRRGELHAGRAKGVLGVRDRKAQLHARGFGGNASLERLAIARPRGEHRRPHFDDLAANAPPPGPGRCREGQCMSFKYLWESQCHRDEAARRAGGWPLAARCLLHDAPAPASGPASARPGPLPTPRFSRKRPFPGRSHL